MNEQFSSIGFTVQNDDALEKLALQTVQLGTAERVAFQEQNYTVYRWRVADRIELWAIVEHSTDQFAAFYPAFLGHETENVTITRLVHDRDMAILAYVEGTRESMPCEFFLANMLPLQGWRIQPQTQVQASIVGLAIGAQTMRPESSTVSPCFIPARDFRPEWDDPAQYAICGTIADVERMVNPLTDVELVWLKLEGQGIPDTEIIIQHKAIRGELRRGLVAFVQCWLQGQILVPGIPASPNGHKP